MSEGKRGFGVAAAVGPAVVRELARRAEDAGYSTFWVNDTPGADGLEMLGAASHVTSSIRLGVGVIPVDRRPAAEIVEAVRRLDLPTERLVVGIGSGARLAGSLDLVKSKADALRAATGTPVAIGALGDRMISLAGRVADGVILNWLTPAWARRSRELLGSREGNRDCEIVGYVRVGLERSRRQVEKEAAHYAAIPQYARHFSRMGVEAVDTCVIGDPAHIAVRLAKFDRVLHETVVRAIAAEESLQEYVEVLQAGAPNETPSRN
jgi:alkanesulfonate monooxygenase SsuD/methylene tetrahydromethanopterin reductase-like flavin-dependent oxidoreductase (luciferase family)